MLKVKKECTGCMACANKCPVGGIQAQLDEYGFIMPVMNENVCIDCGLCEQVCPIVESSEPTVPQAAFSMFHSNPEIVKISSSGGVFYALASQVLEQKGIVFGCCYDIEKKSAYLADTDHLDLTALLASKYIESYIADGLQKVEAELTKNRQVLFCGTPCQTAGLKSYLNQDYNNLLIVDFACGGVAAQPYLGDYLKTLEEEYASKTVRISFRDKHYGWGQYCFLAEFENGKTYRKTAMADPYFFCFLRSSMQRLSCHGCNFSNAHPSDLCLSDFWKCDFFDIERNDRKGISLALAFNDKGEEAIRELDGIMHIEKLNVSEASYHLKPRVCPDSKLSEIHADMECAYRQGVTALRNHILSEEQRWKYDERQRIMDNEEMADKWPEAAGTGQIMTKWR